MTAVQFARLRAATVPLRSIEICRTEPLSGTIMEPDRAVPNCVAMMCCQSTDSGMCSGITQGAFGASLTTLQEARNVAGGPADSLERFCNLRAVTVIDAWTSELHGPRLPALPSSVRELTLDAGITGGCELCELPSRPARTTAFSGHPYSTAQCCLLQARGTGPAASVHPAPQRRGVGGVLDARRV